MMGLALGLPLLVVPALAGDAPDCDQPSTVADFLQAAERGEHAFAAMDLPALSSARERGLLLIPCLGEPITPHDAAAFHRMMALAAFTSGDREAVMREFHAARRLEPGYQIPLEVAPPGHSLVRLYDRSAGADEGELQAVIPPKFGWVNVDGVRGAPRPSGIATLMQVYGKGDVLQESLYLLPEHELPVWGPLPIDDLRRKRRRVTLLSATGATFASSAVLYGVAMQHKVWFWDPDIDRTDDELVELKLRINALGWTSLGLVTLSAGLGVATAFSW